MFKESPDVSIRLCFDQQQKSPSPTILWPLYLSVTSAQRLMVVELFSEFPVLIMIMLYKLFTFISSETCFFHGIFYWYVRETAEVSLWALFILLIAKPVIIQIAKYNQEFHKAAV